MTVKNRDDIDNYLEGRTINAITRKKLEDRYCLTEHKRQPPVSIYCDWWYE